MAQANGTSEQQPPTEQAASDNAPQPEQQQQQQIPATLTDPLQAATSLDDSGQGKRPRDARLLHVILTKQDVQAYQERVPLQLMDFAYRYTSGILSDAVHLSSEGYGSAPGQKANPQSDSNPITLQSLRLAIASRQHYQFHASLPKEHFADLATEKNKIALPPIGKNATLRLPPERYRLTGVGYAFRDEWDHEVEMDDSPAQPATNSNAEGRPNGAADTQMQGVETHDSEGQGDEVMQDA